MFPEQDGLIQSELQTRQPRVVPKGCTGILWESCHQPQEHSHQTWTGLWEAQTSSRSLCILVSGDRTPSIH